ncbi:hypothetical protein [Facklamia sp. P12955]
MKELIKEIEQFVDDALDPDVEDFLLMLRDRLLELEKKEAD